MLLMFEGMFFLLEIKRYWENKMLNGLNVLFYVIKLWSFYFIIFLISKIIN